MHLEDDEVDLLKRWIVTNIEARSDADSDVLAEYVTALVTSDPGDRPASKEHYVENLQDFLSGNTQAFVDDLFLALHTKSFDPSRPPQRYEPTFYQPLELSVHGLPRPLNESRKRSYNDRDGKPDASSRSRSYHSSDRPTKHARRSGRRNRDMNGGGLTQSSEHQYEGLSQFDPLRLPTPPPGMPPMNAETAINAFMAMQQAMGLIPEWSDTGSISKLHGFSAFKTIRCQDYDTKGFCASGTSCPYEHGDDPYVVPSPYQEYESNKSALLQLAPVFIPHIDTKSSARGKAGIRARGSRRGDGSFRGGGRRANFSRKGTNRDPSMTAIVVQQIPLNKCDKGVVHAFFAEFGAIQDIIIRPERSLAIVKFHTNDAARAAYESSKPVFDNRFVKVYWHKPERNPQHRNAQDRPRHEGLNGESFVLEDSSGDDMEIFAKRQEEAQRKYEKTKKRIEEIEKQWQDIESKLKANEVERKKVAKLMATRNGQAFLPLLEPSANDDTESSGQTRALKEQLARLEAEAKSLGIDPEAATANGYHLTRSYHSTRSQRGRGRGGRPSTNYRGGWLKLPSVLRLDNRPKTVAITFTDGDFDGKSETLRQFLVFNELDSTSVEKHPEREDTALVAFQHRYEGEILMECIARSGAQHIGHVDLAWFKADGRATNGVNDHDSKTDVEYLQSPVHVAEVHVSDGQEGQEDEDLDRWS